ncbi:hypothetical protein GGQ72_004622 [Rhizobium rhizoryzae]|uniref:Uncharacterized protein n=1 Tax=Rhizobium rhizoryzae TaxID=451876 RepID=A0A7W6PSZ5_9HYPH|nr:hypothetical protein [Rhizobium rhizoryzae]
MSACDFAQGIRQDINDALDRLSGQAHIPGDRCGWQRDW